MNTIEALIALMMLLGVVGIAVQLHAQSARVLSSSALYKAVRERRGAAIRESAAAAGEAPATYRRWFFCKRGRAGC